MQMKIGEKKIQTTFYENLILILQFKMFALQFNLLSWFFVILF